MSTLLLRLAAPMQAWGTDSKFDVRQTAREPSKSGVVGLLAAALGTHRDDDAMLERLSMLHFGVRVEQEGTLLRDFHMVRTADGTSYLTHRYYLADAVFLVGLESDDEEWLTELNAALQNPVFPLFLGRRSCPPTLPLTLGIRPTGLRQALRDEPWQASDWQREQWDRRHADEDPQLRMFTDAAPWDARVAVQKDRPISFDPADRRYGYRGVVDCGFITPCQNRLATRETIHDAMAELR